MTPKSGSMPINKLSAFTPSYTATIRTNSSWTTKWSFILPQTRRLWRSTSKSKNNAVVDLQQSRSLAQVRSESFSELWFTAAFPTKVQYDVKENGILKTTTTLPGPGSGQDHKPPDERTLKLGKTLRVLSPLLPTILTAPLPHEILSPNVTLHLFPSTHPHLPVVKGRVPFRAALWTAPVAWGSVPIVGNVKLIIVSEKMVRTGYVSAPTIRDNEDSDGQGEEKLVVRWRTEEKNAGDSKTTNGSTSSMSGAGSSPSSFSSATENGGINRGLSVLLGGSQPLFSSKSNEPFTGLFVFSFDREGRIASQTIEHTDEGHGCDRTGTIVSLTDWLLGRARWGAGARVEDGAGGLIPGLAMRATEDEGRYLRWWGRTRR